MALAIPTLGYDHARMMENYNRYTMAGILSRDESVGNIVISYNGNHKVIYNLSDQTIEDMARGMGILARMWFSIGAKSVITSHRDVPEMRTKSDIPKLKEAVREIYLCGIFLLIEAFWSYTNHHILLTSQ